MEFKALVIPTQSPSRVTETSCDIILIGVPGFKERDHRIGFGSAVCHIVMGEHYAMDGNHPPSSFGPKQYTVIYNGRPFRGWGNQLKFLLFWRHGGYHARPRCYFKSGQV